jgi:hypothetical protein
MMKNSRREHAIQVYRYGIYDLIDLFNEYFLIHWLIITKSHEENEKETNESSTYVDWVQFSLLNMN